MIESTTETQARTEYVAASQAYMSAKRAYEQTDDRKFEPDKCPLWKAYYEAADAYARSLAVYIADHRPELTEHISPMTTVRWFLEKKAFLAYIYLNHRPENIRERAMLLNMVRQMDYQEVTLDVITKAEELLALEGVRP